MKKRIVAMLLVLALCASVFAGGGNTFNAELGLKFDFDREKALKFDTAYAQVGVKSAEYGVSGDITYVYSVSGTDFINHFENVSEDTSFFGALKMKDRSKSGLYFSVKADGKGFSRPHTPSVTSSTSLNFGIESVLYVALDEGRFGKPESLTTTVSAGLDSIQSFGKLSAYTQIGHVDKFDKDSENNGYLFNAKLNYSVPKETAREIDLDLLTFDAIYQAVLNFDGLKLSAEDVKASFGANVGVNSFIFKGSLQRFSACEYEEDNGVYAAFGVSSKKDKFLFSEFASVLQFSKDNGKLSRKLACAEFAMSSKNKVTDVFINNSSMRITYNNTAEKHDVKVDVATEFDYTFSFESNPCIDGYEHLSLDFYNLDSKIKMDLESHTRIGLDVNPTVPSFVGEPELDICGVFFQDLKLTDGVKTVKNGFDFYVPFNGMLEF